MVAYGDETSDPPPMPDGGARRAGHRGGRRPGGQDPGRDSASDHRRAGVAIRAGCPGRRLHGRRTVEVPGTSRQAPQHPLEHRTVQELPQLLQRVRRGDRVGPVGHRLRSGDSRAPDDAAATAVRRGLHERQCARGHRTAGGAVDRAAACGSRDAGRGPDSDHRQQRLVRRDRRTPRDHHRRQCPQPAHHAARARTLARRAD